MTSVHKKTIGIDLGTSNSSLSYDLIDGEGRKNLLIAQLTGRDLVAEEKTLPSALYFPNQDEVNHEALSWRTQDNEFILGEWARTRSLETPMRTVLSAKSWLCHPFVDKKSKILPWQSEEENKVSPYEVSVFLLRYLKEAFLFTTKANIDPSDTKAVVTVPASFDESARSLTYQAAQEAGLSDILLLEEPQSALYSWLEDHEKDWRDYISPSDIILVCDVGGGTTDFTLVCVAEQDGLLHLERISVGRHLLLGGDNMDLTLAHHASQALQANGKKLDHWQFLSLVGQMRQAKEKLLADEELQEINYSVAGKGSSIFAQTISGKIDREEVEKIIVEGFFPIVEKTDQTVAASDSGFKELGLHYETDPQVTRHLAEFLQKSLKNVLSSERLSSLLSEQSLSQAKEKGMLLPTHVLFNGGVFKSNALRKRLLAQLTKWNEQGKISELVSDDLELAVCKGARYFAQLKSSGKGIRIQAGTACSYYIGVESSQMAIPGFKPQIKGLCIVPQGTKEGTHLPSIKKQFGLVTGEPAHFRFFSSSERAGDQVGSLVDDAEIELIETEGLKLTLPPLGDTGKELVPVELDCSVSDVGMLELLMFNKTQNKKWQLEFNVRQE